MIIVRVEVLSAAFRDVAREASSVDRA